MNHVAWRRQAKAVLVLKTSALLSATVIRSSWFWGMHFFFLLPCTSKEVISTWPAHSSCSSLFYEKKKSAEKVYRSTKSPEGAFPWRWRWQSPEPACRSHMLRMNLSCWSDRAMDVEIKTLWRTFCTQPGLYSFCHALMTYGGQKLM